MVPMNHSYGGPHDKFMIIQGKAAVNKASRLLDLINRSFTFKNKSNMIQLYKSLVHPHLEYAI